MILDCSILCDGDKNADKNAKKAKNPQSSWNVDDGSYAMQGLN